MRALLLLLGLALFGASLRAEVPPAERLADAALAYAQAEARKLGGNHSFKVVQPPRVPPMKPGRLDVEPSHLSRKDPVGRFFVVVWLKVDGERVGMARVDLEGHWVGTLLRAKGDLARKTSLTAEQVEESPFDGVPPEGALTALPEGLRLQRAVPAGRILTRADLEAIPLVQPGDKVRLTASHGALSISVDATAKGKGGLGDRVALETPGGKRPVVGVITAAGEARLP